MESAVGEQRRSVLAATVITLIVVPLLVLSNLSLRSPQQTVNLAVSTRGHVVTESVTAAAAPGAEPTTVPELAAASAAGAAGVVAPDPIEAAPVAPAGDPSTPAAPTSVPPSTPAPDPPTTAAPTTAAPTTAAPTTAAPTTAAPPPTAPPTTTPPTTTAAPTTAPPTTAPPTTAAPGVEGPAGEDRVAAAPTTLPVVAKDGGPSHPTAEIWQQLARCESGSRWDTDTGNGYYGGLQFSLSSWRFVGGSGYPHEHSMAEQIYRAERLWTIQGWEAWPTCARRIGLI